MASSVVVDMVGVGEELGIRVGSCVALAGRGIMFNAWI